MRFQQLNLQDCELDFVCAKALLEVAEVVSETPEGSGVSFSLNLRHNVFGSAGAEALSSLGARVQRLNLAWNQIGETGGRAIAEHFVVSGVCEELDLRDNPGLGPGFAKMLADGLSNESNHWLEILHLANTGMTSHAAFAFCSALPRLQALESLKLYMNPGLGTDPDCAGRIARMLSNTCLLLDLAGCAIHDAGATALAQALKTNGSLRSLNLADNKIRANGAKALAEMLSIQHELEEVILSLNELGDDGLASLVKVLSTVNCAVETLDVVGCSISPSEREGIEEMFKAFKARENGDLTAHSHYEKSRIFTAVIRTSHSGRELQDRILFGAS
jgi:hypothetical protein